jgi:hypothetical protein
MKMARPVFIGMEQSFPGNTSSFQASSDKGCGPIVKIVQRLFFNITMRLHCVLILSLLAGSGCGGSALKVSAVAPGPDAAFSFVYSEYFHETSKDSNSHRTSYTMKNGRLVYDYVYVGYPDPGNSKKHREIRVDRDSVERLRAKLKELQLYMNYSKSYPVEKRGMTINTGRSLCITDGDGSYRITVTGGLPLDIHDRVGDRLSEFGVFVERLLRK